MGNEVSQETESNTAAQTPEALQPWTALSLYPQTVISKDPPEHKNPITKVPTCKVSDTSETVPHIHASENKMESNNLTRDETVKQVSGLSLTAEEMDHINQVLSRVMELEQREDARITKLRNELQRKELEVRRRVSISQQNVTIQNLVCVLCGRMQQTKTVEQTDQEPITWHLCADCENQVCEKCGSLFGKESDENKTWLCNLCQKKRRLEVSTGSWLQDLQKTPRQSKALKKIFAKKPIARTSSFTQYEEWRARIENDTQSDTSSTDDRSVPAQTPEMRRHSDAPTSGNAMNADIRITNRQMLSRDCPIQLSPTCATTDTGGSSEAEHSETELMKHLAEEDELAQDRHLTEETLLMELAADTKSSRGHYDNEPQSSSDKQGEIDSIQETKRHTTTYTSQQIEPEIDLIMDSSEVHINEPMKESLFAPESQEPSYDDSSSPYEPEVVIHPDTTEVKSLFLREPPIAAERERTVTAATVKNLWSDTIDEYNEHFAYGYGEMSSTEPMEMYESFNNTFDENPVYADRAEFELSTFKKPKKTRAMEQHDKWFGSQEISIEPQIIQPDSFFAANTIRRLSAHQTESLIGERIQLDEFEEINDNPAHFQHTSPSELRIDTDGQRKSTNASLWYGLEQQRHPVRRASDSAQLQPSNLGQAGADTESNVLRRASAPQTIAQGELREVETQQSSFETHMDSQMAKPAIASFDDHKVSDRSDMCSNRLAQKQFSYPFDMTKPTVNYSDSTDLSDSEVFEVKNTDEYSLDQNIPSQNDYPQEFSSSTIYPDVGSYEQWISEITGYTNNFTTVNDVIDSNTEDIPYDKKSYENHQTSEHYEEDSLSILRRCPNFENISGLSEQVQTHTDEEVHGGKDEKRFLSELEIVEEEQELYNHPEDEPTRVWYRSPTNQVTVDPSMLTTLQQEDEIWATLFSPSDSLVESAKEVAAQLDLMTLAEDEASEALEYTTLEHRMPRNISDLRKDNTDRDSEESEICSASSRVVETDVNRSYLDQTEQQPEEDYFATFPTATQSKIRSSSPEVTPIEEKRTTSSPPQSKSTDETVSSRVTVKSKQTPMKDLPWCYAQEQWNTPKMTETANRSSWTTAKLFQTSESIEPHMSDKFGMRCAPSVRASSPTLVPAISSSTIGDSYSNAVSVHTDAGGNGIHQYISSEAMNEVSVTQTDGLTDGKLNQTGQSDGHVIETESKTSQLRGEREQTHSRLDVYISQSPQGKEHAHQGQPREEFGLNANSLTSFNLASTTRVWTKIDVQCSSPTTSETTNENQGDGSIPIGLSVEKHTFVPGETERERKFEFEEELEERLIDRRYPVLSESGVRNFKPAETSVTPSIRTEVDAGSNVPFYDEPNAQPQLDSNVAEKVKDTVFCEQPTSDLISPPLPVCSAISPQRQASLIRLSVQRDRGLGLARRTLTSAQSGGPDTSDSFLSLLEIVPEIETQSSLTEFVSGSNLLVESPSYISPAKCCSAWNYRSSTHLGQNSHNSLVDQVITTEPVLIPTVPDLNERLIPGSNPTLLITESDECGLKPGRISCNFRRRVLEEIREDQILVSTQPCTVNENTTVTVVTNTLMSSSSSSRSSYMMSRRRPRSTSYTYDYYRTTGCDPFGVSANPIPATCSQYYSDRTKQRSLTDITPKNGYDLYWNEMDVPASYLTNISTRTDPYEDMTSQRKLSDRIINELGNRYSTLRANADPPRFGYPQSYSASQTIERHRSLPSDDYEYFKEASRMSRNLGVSRMSKYSTGPRPMRRFPPRREYPRTNRSVGEDRRWQFRSTTYSSGTRDSTENSGSNLSDDADYTDGRLPHSLLSSYPTVRRTRDSSATGARSLLGMSRGDNFHSLRRPASLTSRITSQLWGNKCLSRSTDHLSFRRVSGVSGTDTSMQTLRARLAAAHSESHLDRSDGFFDEDSIYDRGRQKYGSLDRRMHSDHLATQQLRRQVEKQHRQLLRSLMDDKSSSLVWPPNLSLLHPQPSGAIPISPQFMSENPISPVLASIDREPGTLISTTGAPPIFSTATSRPGLGPAYGWPVQVPMSLPDPIASRFTTDFNSPVIQPNPMLLDGTATQRQTPSKPMSAEAIINNTNAMAACQPPPIAPSEQPPPTTSLLELLGNTELLQSMASDPALTSHLASLGIDLTIPQANQVTLAAVAGAVAATAIAQSGVFETPELDDTQAPWPELNTVGPAEQIAAVNDVSFVPADYTNSLPPYTVSNTENQNLEHLLQQLQNALGTTTTPEQILNYSEQTDRVATTGTLDVSDAIGIRKSYPTERAMDERFAPEHLGTGVSCTGPSETIDSWLMPNSDHQEHKFLVNGVCPNVGLMTSAECSNITPSHRVSGSTKSNQRITYNFPTKRILLMRDTKDRFQRDNGIGMRIVGGHIRSDGNLGAFVEEIYPRGPADQLHGEIREGDEILEWNSIPLIGKTFEEVQSIISQVSEETELLVRARSDSSTERDGSQPWEVSRMPGENRKAHSPKRVDALCHHHAAQQALMGLQSRSMCPHMQRHYLSMSPSEMQQSPVTMLPSSRGHTSPTGSDSNSSNARKSSMGQALWTGGQEIVTRDPPSTHLRTDHYSPHVSHVAQPNDFEDIDVDDLRQFDHQSKSPSQQTQEKMHRNSKSDDIIDEYGEIELILTFDDYDQSLTVHVSRARGLPSMDLNGLADPFVKVRLHPDPTEDPDFNRQTKYMPNTLAPEWQQTVVFMNCFKRTLKRRVLEVTVWDFDRLKTNDFMGQTLINLGDKSLLDGRPHWYKLHKLKPVVIPSARKTPPSAKSAGGGGQDNSKQAKVARETMDKKSTPGKSTGKESSASHRVNM